MTLHGWSLVNIDLPAVPDRVDHTSSGSLGANGNWQSSAGRPSPSRQIAIAHLARARYDRPATIGRRTMGGKPTLALTGVKQRLDARNADLAGSAFNDVRLSGATFGNVDLSNAVIENADMSRCQAHNINLEGVRLTDCKLDGMTIDGIAVTDLLAAYRTALQVG